MQPKTSRGVCHVLVATGVVSLVLSIAAPAALAADHSQRSGNPHAQNVERGTTRTLVCHKGRVLEVDDDGAYGGHEKHGDAVWKSGTADDFRELCVRPVSDTPIEQGDPVAEHDEHGEDEELVEIDVCRDGQLETIDFEDLREDEVGIVTSETGILTPCPTADEELEEEIEETTDGGESTDPNGGPDGPTPQQDVVGSTDQVPDDASAPTDGTGPQGPPVISAVTVTRPLEPAAPVPALAGPTAPASAAPTAPAPSSAAPVVSEVSSRQETAVLGDVTTRIPSVGAGALDPGVRTTALAATGFDHTAILAALGGVLLLSGLALMLLGRTRVRRTA